jgi:phage-related protein
MVYLARIEDRIYVLDCFEKDTAKTERRELRTAQSRWSQVKQRIPEVRRREKRKQ